MKKIKNVNGRIVFYSIMIAFFLALAVFSMPAGVLALSFDQVGGDNVNSGLDFGDESPVEIVKKLISFALGLLALISVVIILIAGFKWMTAGGNEDKVTESKKMMTQGLIGLIIVLAAWSIAKFVIEVALNVTTS